jgi:hypothetical protein
MVIATKINLSEIAIGLKERVWSREVGTVDCVARYLKRVRPTSEVGGSGLGDVDAA